MSNLSAFLSMIANSEGTSTCPATQDNGYDILVGGTRFDSYADHPRILVDLGNGLKSTAAGRYQLLERYYNAYKAQLNIPDFSPNSQDIIASQQIAECHAMDDIMYGNFPDAVSKVAHIWASLPSAGYGQHEKKLADLQQIYVNLGGSLA